jgi:hypothetical protein
MRSRTRRKRTSVSRWSFSLGHSWLLNVANLLDDVVVDGDESAFLLESERTRSVLVAVCRTCIPRSRWPRWRRKRGRAALARRKSSSARWPASWGGRSLDRVRPSSPRGGPSRAGGLPSSEGCPSPFPPPSRPSLEEEGALVAIHNNVVEKASQSPYGKPDYDWDKIELQALLRSTEFDLPPHEAGHLALEDFLRARAALPRHLGDAMRAWREGAGWEEEQLAGLHGLGAFGR